MIKLRNILTEITLGAVQPYATQFVWQQTNREMWTSKIIAQGNPITFKITMVSNSADTYVFKYMMQNSMHGGWTIDHGTSKSLGIAAYLRIARTAFEAIMDFCRQHAPDAIEITGSDDDMQRGQQKSRIYHALATANSSILQQAGYVMQQRANKLWLIRTNKADATGTK